MMPTPKPSHRLGFCLAALLAALPSGHASAAQLDPDQPIDIELKSASLQETLRSFAQISGSDLDIEPGIQGEVSIDLKSTPWRRALDRICSDHRLNCELLSGEPSVLRVRSTGSAAGAAAQAGYAEAIDMSLARADLRQTLQAFGVIGHREVLVDDDVSGTVTIEIQHAPWTVVLEEICNLSGCRIEWSESVLRILPAAPLPAARRAPLRLVDAPLAEALESLADLPIFGPLGRPEVVLEDGLQRALTLELDGASWLDALNAVCRAAACRWQLRYGAPSRLTVRPTDPGPGQQITLPGEPLTVAAAAEVLARSLDLQIEWRPGVDPEGEVRFAVPEASWQDAARAMCQQADCFWAIRDRQLVLSPRVKALAARPPTESAGRRVAVRFLPPSASIAVGGTARFTWAAPIHTFDSAAAGSREVRWLARLSWIPFGPEHHFLIPAIVRCSSGETPQAHLFAPLPLPLDEPSSQRWSGAVLELSQPVAADDAAGSGSRNPDDCTASTGSKIRVTFHRVGRSRASASVLDLETRVGAYLLVTPPDSGRQPSPLAAILALGAGPGGTQRIALVRPTGDGSAATAEQRTLPAVGELVESLRLADGRDFELVLQSVRGED